MGLDLLPLISVNKLKNASSPAKIKTDAIYKMLKAVNGHAAHKQ